MCCDPPSDLPPVLARLLEPAAYPHWVTGLRLIQTHVSWVILTGKYAYKLKRRVVFPFIDLRSPRMRELCCREELRLNRRFSAGLYLRVVPVVATPAGAQVDGEGRVIEHAVQMTQFDPDEVLDRLLPDRVAAEELAAFGRSMAELQAGFPVVDRDRPWGTAAAVGEQILRNASELRATAADEAQQRQVSALHARLAALLKESARQLEGRSSAGAIRECHGDLHARNVVRWQGRLVAFDGLEFDPSLRWIDVVRDMAMLDVDLRARGFGRRAHAVLQAWMDASGDHAACGVLDLYRVHGSLVRAKVCLLSPGERWLAPRYLAAAEAALERRSPWLVLVGGLSGAGKTSLARALAPLIDAIVVRSDIERKRLTGARELDRTGSPLAAGAYTPERSAAVQKTLLERALQVLDGRQTVIVDATFLRADDRERFAVAAHRLGCRFLLIWCEAPSGMLQTRVAARREAGADASEADERVLQWQQERVQRPIVDGAECIAVSTVEPSERLAAQLAESLGFAGST